jgi:hypothetical protein
MRLGWPSIRGMLPCEGGEQLLPTTAGPTYLCSVRMTLQQGPERVRRRGDCAVCSQAHGLRSSHQEARPALRRSCSSARSVLHAARMQSPSCVRTTWALASIEMHGKRMISAELRCLVPSSAAPRPMGYRPIKTKSDFVSMCPPPFWRASGEAGIESTGPGGGWTRRSHLSFESFPSNELPLRGEEEGGKLHTSMMPCYLCAAAVPYARNG